MTGTIPIDTAIFPASEWTGQTELAELVRGSEQALLARFAPLVRRHRRPHLALRRRSRGRPLFHGRESLAAYRRDPGAGGPGADPCDPECGRKKPFQPWLLSLRRMKTPAIVPNRVLTPVFVWQKQFMMMIMYPRGRNGNLR